MKFKMLAFVLALTVASWAQTTTPTPDAGKAPAAQAQCCHDCAKTASADHKEGHVCTHHKGSATDAKETASCCEGKESAACSKDHAASCCKDKDGKACAKDDKTAADCCGSKCGHEMGCHSGKEAKAGS